MPDQTCASVVDVEGDEEDGDAAVSSAQDRQHSKDNSSDTAAVRGGEARGA
jgi:hypothetical protein